MAVTGMWLLGMRYWRRGLDTVTIACAAAWGHMSLPWADGVPGPRGLFMAVVGSAQAALRVPLWFLVWAPLTTFVGTVALHGDRWPLVVTALIFSGQVVLAAWHGAPPPADACANLMWLTADIKAHRPQSFRRPQSTYLQLEESFAKLSEKQVEFVREAKGLSHTAVVSNEDKNWINSTYERLWKVKWEAEQKEAYWRLVVGGFSGFSMHRGQQRKCPCGATMRTDREVCPRPGSRGRFTSDGGGVSGRVRYMPVTHEGMHTRRVPDTRVGFTRRSVLCTSHTAFINATPSEPYKYSYTA